VRLVTFEAGEGARVGAVADNSVLDLVRLAEADGGRSVPDSMLGLVQAGTDVWNRAREVATTNAEKTGSLPGGTVYPLSGVTLLAPIPRPAKNIFCLGVNYAAHLEESNRASGRSLAPTVPVFFTKAVTSVVAPYGPILFQEDVSVKYDWEAELGVVIGHGGRNITRENAMGHIFGYTCFNDVTARDIQNDHIQWFRGKSLDGTCPFGPWIITADEVPDPHNLKIECRVNGEVKQSSNTSLLINDIPSIIYWLTRGLTIETGDLISTGTPAGVGHGRIPPEYLKPGDIVEVEVEGVGLLRNQVVDAREL
jgi:2-keto-4-pentenoate hydratase/2-oxohepta-3-ene-1,7-dioic acid hydratase in catechol pathway